LGEEASELAVACADGDVARVKAEAADVVYHTLVAALAAGVGLEAILEALEARRG
jgi:phosphoribosyl-ATP pyrophosphohydrolase